MGKFVIGKTLFDIVHGHDSARVENPHGTPISILHAQERFWFSQKLHAWRLGVGYHETTNECCPLDPLPASPGKGNARALYSKKYKGYFLNHALARKEGQGCDKAGSEGRGRIHQCRFVGYRVWCGPQWNPVRSWTWTFQEPVFERGSAGFSFSTFPG